MGELRFWQPTSEARQGEYTKLLYRLEFDRGSMVGLVTVAPRKEQILGVQFLPSRIRPPRHPRAPPPALQAPAAQRLSLLEDGRYGYRTKRGPTLILTGAELVKRLVALVPARSRHLTSFHGVFAPRARLRPSLIPPAEEPAPSAPVLSTSPPLRATPAVSPRRPRLDWATLQRRTFGVDVWRCLCGRTRTVPAVVTSPRAAEEVLRNMGLLGPRALPPSGPGPPQLSLAV